MNDQTTATPAIRRFGTPNEVRRQVETIRRHLSRVERAADTGHWNDAYSEAEAAQHAAFDLKDGLR